MIWKQNLNLQLSLGTASKQKLQNSYLSGLQM